MKHMQVNHKKAALLGLQHFVVTPEIRTRISGVLLCLN